ncbi:MAG: hypothetical protein KDA77_19950, partial [Planctomycetaceae bacterium]|nr:hypothetical protein [Planctomycetaceae bacterium]
MSYDWIMDGQGEFARPLPDSLVTSLIPVKAIGFYLLNKSLVSGFNSADLEYFEELINFYNASRSENLPLDIPSAFNASLFHLYPNDQYFGQIAAQLTELPEPYSVQAVALASILKAMHLDGPFKEDGVHELEIILKYLKFGLAQTQNADVNNPDIRALEIGTVRLLMLLEKYLSYDFNVPVGGFVAQIRNPIASQLRTELENIIPENRTQILSMISRAPYSPTPARRFSEIVETDPYLERLSVTAYWPEAIEEIFFERAEYSLYQALLNRSNPDTQRYLNHMLEKFKTLSLHKLHLEILKELQRKGSDVAERIEKAVSNYPDVSGSIQYGYVNGDFIERGHQPAHRLRLHIQSLGSRLSEDNKGQL